MSRSRRSKAPQDQTSCLRPGAISIDRSVKLRPLSFALASQARQPNSKTGEPGSGTNSDSFGSVLLWRRVPVPDLPAVSTGCSSQTRFRPFLPRSAPAKRPPSPHHPPRPLTTRLPRKRRPRSLKSPSTVSPTSRGTRPSRNSSSFTPTFSRTSKSTPLLR